MPRIDKVLFLSTGLITGEAAAKLNAADVLEHAVDIPGWSGWPLEYGWLVWVPNPAHHDDNYSLAEPWLRAIYDLALAHGCTYIRFDCDESEIDELPVHEW